MRIMRLKEVIDTTGLARSTIYKYIADGIFPKPVNLAPAGMDMPSTRAWGGSSQRSMIGSWQESRSGIWLRDPPHVQATI